MDGQEARYSLYSEDAMRRSMRRSQRSSKHQKKNKTADALGVVAVDDADYDASSFVNNKSVGGDGGGRTRNNNEDEDLPFFQMLREEIVHPKWRMLFFICMLYFGKQFIYDFPSSFGTGEGSTIEARFREHGKEYNQKMNQALYSVYAYPNMILALVGGVLIDKILGIRRSVILFSVLITLGGFIFWIGVQTVQYPVMVLGRFVVGLGGESIAVAKTAFIARWFYGGRGLSFAYGVTITGIRLGSGLNFLISPTIADDRGVSIACLVGVSLCVFSTMCALMLVWMDTRYDRLGFLPEPAKQLAAAALTSTTTPAGDDDTNDGATATTTTTAAATPISVCEHLKRMPRQIYELSGQYWLLCGICVCLYGSDLPFIGFAKNFFQVKWDLSPTEAGLAMSVYQLVSAVASPITGAFIDKIGRHAFVLFISSALFTSTHVILAWTSVVPPIVIMVMQGLFFSLMIPSLWPSVPIVVDPSLVAVGFGLMMSIQNIGIATIPLFVGSILDAHTPSDEVVIVPSNSSNSTTNSSTTTTTLAPVRKAAVDSTVEGYITVEYVMLGIGAVGVALALILVIYDLKKDRLLTGSPASRTKRLDVIDDERERLLQGSDIEEVNTTTTM